MSNQDLLIEDDDPGLKWRLNRLKMSIIIGFLTCLFILFLLHFFGKWSIVRHNITHFNGSADPGNMNFLSAETKFTFNNRCLIFGQSHSVDESFSGYLKGHDLHVMNWQIITSFKFIFADHLILMLLSLMLAIFLYYLFRNFIARRVPQVMK